MSMPSTQASWQWLMMVAPDHGVWVCSTLCSSTPASLVWNPSIHASEHIQASDNFHAHSLMDIRADMSTCRLLQEVCALANLSEKLHAMSLMNVADVTSCQ